MVPEMDMGGKEDDKAEGDKAEGDKK